jgi:hypothetical protein
MSFININIKLDNKRTHYRYEPICKIQLNKLNLYIDRDEVVFFSCNNYIIERNIPNNINKRIKNSILFYHHITLFAFKFKLF